MKLFSILEKKRVNNIIKKDSITSLSPIDNKVINQSPLNILNNFNNMSTFKWDSIINEDLKLNKLLSQSTTQSLSCASSIQTEKKISNNTSKQQMEPNSNKKAIGPDVKNFSVLQTISHVIDTQDKKLIGKDKLSKHKEGTKDFNILKYKLDRKELLKRKESFSRACLHKQGCGPVNWNIFEVNGNPKFKGISGKRKYSTINNIEKPLSIIKKEGNNEIECKQIEIPASPDINLFYLYFLFCNYKNLTIYLPRTNNYKLFNNLFSLSSIGNLPKKTNMYPCGAQEGININNINFNKFKDIILDNKIFNKVIRKARHNFLSLYSYHKPRLHTLGMVRDIEQLSNLKSINLVRLPLCSANASNAAMFTQAEMLNDEEFFNFILNISISMAAQTAQASFNIKKNIKINSYLALTNKVFDTSTFSIFKGLNFLLSKGTDLNNYLLTPTIFCLETNSFPLIFSTFVSNLDKEAAACFAFFVCKQTKQHPLAPSNLSQDIFSSYKNLINEKSSRSILAERSKLIGSQRLAKVNKQKGKSNKVFYILPFSLKEILCRNTFSYALNSIEDNKNTIFTKSQNIVESSGINAHLNNTPILNKRINPEGKVFTLSDKSYNIVSSSSTSHDIKEEINSKLNSLKRLPFNDAYAYAAKQANGRERDKINKLLSVPLIKDNLIGKIKNNEPGTPFVTLYTSSDLEGTGYPTRPFGSIGSIGSLFKQKAALANADGGERSILRSESGLGFPGPTQPFLISKKMSKTESYLFKNDNQMLSNSYPLSLTDKKGSDAQYSNNKNNGAYYMNIRKFLFKYNLISHPTLLGEGLGQYQVIAYNFIKMTKKINTLNSFDLTGYVTQFKKNSSTLLKYFFKFIGPALISKPVFIFNNNKIIIQLAYYLNKKLFYYKFKKFITINYVSVRSPSRVNLSLPFKNTKISNLTLPLLPLKSNLSLLPQILAHNLFGQASTYNPGDVKVKTVTERSLNRSISFPNIENAKAAMFTQADKNKYSKLIRIQKRNSILFVLNKKLNALTLILEKFFNCSVQLEFTRLYYPFHNSNILAQIIGLNGKKYNFEKIVKLLFSSRIHAIINNPKNNFKNIDFFKNIKNSNSTQHLNSLFNKGIAYAGNKIHNNRKIKYNSLISLLSGIKLRVAGRFYKHNIIPRLTVKTAQKGSLGRGVVNYVDSSKFINKSKRGSFCVTVSISHIY